MACIRGLTGFSEILFSNAVALPQFAEYLPASKYHAAVSGILRQGVERLDNVRQTAGDHIARLLVLPLPTTSDSSQWRIEGETLMHELFLTYVFYFCEFLDAEQGPVVESATLSLMDGRTAHGYSPGPSNFCKWKNIGPRFSQA
jgi:hypothetical protein